ncbi:tol-pal system protein YbgF [Pelomonas sp. SE-A7]|uniref:tol-pal system protein YbgF n=1 Tax=Pelomonas sp. SE-A7 TaxID=3054953 RepID=UPI00259CFC20|nr:tol-pal system protein YbgF [Pelomonas sp. SE-A7]MDM4765882.1 tol-pal system protein YbgF [Pelomonas sp. SE-A7]
MNARASMLAVALAAMASLFGSLSSAQAGVFDDDEARKAIVDLRTQVKQNDEASKARVDQLAGQMNDLLLPLRRSILDLNGQIEALRADVAKLRGQNEQLARDLTDAQRKLTDQVLALESRLRPLEPQKVSLDGKDFQVDPEERRQYEAATGLVRRGDFAEADAALQAFLRRYSASGYADSVRFSLGIAQYGNRNCKDAITSFKAFIASAKDHPRAPDAALTLANCQADLKDVKAAKRSLEELIKTYPGTEQAKAAKERLTSLK